MKDFLKKIFDIHSVIGKICILFCVTVVIGLAFGTTKIAKKNDVVAANYFSMKQYRFMIVIIY